MSVPIHTISIIPFRPCTDGLLTLSFNVDRPVCHPPELSRTKIQVSSPSVQLQALLDSTARAV